MINSKENKTIVISIDVEEWYHSNWFDINKMGYKSTDFLSDLPLTMNRLTSIFNEMSIQATFFILLEALNNHKRILDDLIKSNHEIALHGVEHKGVKTLGEIEFERQIIEGKKKLEIITNSRIYGYRAPNTEINKNGMKILAANGFNYDSSIVPCINIPGWYGTVKSPLYPHKYLINNENENHILEFPIAVYPRFRLPGGGGWYFRNIGYNWTKQITKALLKKTGFAVLYFHPWEFSNTNPSIKGIPFHVFRRTGDWAFNALKSLINNFKKDVSFRSFKGCIEDGLINV